MYSSKLTLAVFIIVVNINKDTSQVSEVLKPFNYEDVLFRVGDNYS
jgi:hypothetical protein